MKQVKVGLIGANWMGSFHSIGLTNVRQAYHDVEPIFEHVADVNAAAAQLAADRFGYKKVSTDWHEVVNDPEVELVIIATPNFTHAEIAIEAAAHPVREADGEHARGRPRHGRCHRQGRC